MSKEGWSSVIRRHLSIGSDNAIADLIHFPTCK